MWRVLLLALAAPAVAAEPDVTITLGTRQATATPSRVGFTHTGGGNVLVSQPSPDTVVVLMAGVAVAGAHPCKDSAALMAFELMQEVEIAISKKEIKAARVTVEARLIGLLRSHCHGGGSASISCPAEATLSPCGDGPSLLHVEMQGRSAAGGESLSVNDQRGPVMADMPAGKYVLNQRFAVQASHPCNWLPCKSASAEFAPDPALDPLWISAYEPFKGAQKKDFGYQVTVKVSAAPAAEEPAKKEAGEKK